MSVTLFDLNYIQPFRRLPILIQILSLHKTNTFFSLFQYITCLIIVILAELAAGIYLAIQRADVSNNMLFFPIYILFIDVLNRTTIK